MQMTTAPSPVLVLLLSATACVSTSSLKEARALDPGTLRVDVAPALSVARPRSGATAFLQGGQPSPTDSSEQAKDFGFLELQVRYGIARGFDLGLKTGITSLELNGTIELARGQRFGVALAPAIQGALGSNGDDEGWELFLFKLPVLFDVRFGADGRHALVLGPSIAKSLGHGTMKNQGYSVDALLSGASVGVSLEIIPGIRITPEISLYTPLSGHGVALPGHVVRVSPDVGFGRPVLIQAGLGFSFGAGSSSP